MKVIVKRPEEGMMVEEVSGLEEINKIVGNVDEEGNGINRTGTDSRQSIYEGIDMYMNENTAFSTDLPRNFWDKNGNRLYCGNVVIAGYKPGEKGYGVCSLSDEQINFVFKHISEKYDIWF